MVHPSAFVLNGLRLVVVATPGRHNGHLLSTRSDDDDDDDDTVWYGKTRMVWLPES